MLLFRLNYLMHILSITNLPLLMSFDYFTLTLLPSRLVGVPSNSGSERIERC